MNLLFILLSFACSHPEQGCLIFDPPGYVMQSAAPIVICKLINKIEGHFRMLGMPYTGNFTRAV